MPAPPDPYAGVQPAAVPDDIRAQAHALLATLPTDYVPERQPSLPPGSRLKLAPNPHFVGRERDLRTLARLLKGDTSAVVNQVALTGLGGIGKTQLAAAFAHRYGRYFAGGVFWVSFDNPSAILDEIDACGRTMVAELRPDYGERSQQERVAEVLEAWCGALPRLLIFDNCEVEELLSRWRPPYGAARLLLTSRRQRWSRSLGVQTHQLGVLARVDSVALLRKHRENVDGETLGQLATAVGRLPLALHLVGSYLETYAYDPPGDPLRVLARLRSDDLLQDPILTEITATYSPTGHDLHVARTFAVSLGALNLADAIDRQALRLLVAATFFLPGEPFPRALLYDASRETGVEATDEASARGLARLLDLGLLQRGEGGDVYTHRLLNQYVRATQPELLGPLRDAVEAACLAAASRDNATPTAQPLSAWLAHLRHVVEASGDERLIAGSLWNALGVHLHRIAAHAAAYAAFARALAIFETLLGPEDPETATCLNNVGVTLMAQGKLDKARPYFERALLIMEKRAGPEDPRIAGSLNSLGALLSRLGQYEEARRYYERALAIREKGMGAEHPDTANSLNNLGNLHSSMGAYAEARHYHARALAIYEKTLGAEDPHTATSLNNLGALHLKMGQYAEARTYYKRALDIQEKALGPEHPVTAGSLNNLGDLLSRLGKYKEALPYLERAVAINEKVLGPGHLETATSLNNLGHLLQSLGKLEEAQSYLERALTINKKVLGVAHERTASNFINLGQVLQAQGKLEAARLYYEQALAVREELLGATHQDTAVSLGNLGALLKDEGKLEEARAYMERALAIYEAAPGPAQPERAATLNNLGHLLRSQGKLQEAQPYFVQALEILLPALGIEHPWTQSAAHSLAHLQRLLNDEEE